MFDFGLNTDQEAHANELHAKIITWDMLTESSCSQAVWDNMAADGGLSGGSFTIGTMGLHRMKAGSSGEDTRFEDWWTYETTMADFGFMNGVYTDANNRIIAAKSVADIKKAKADGNVALMLNTQNSLWIGYVPDRIKSMYNLGLRVCQLTYNQQNLIASGCQDDLNNHLSEFGVKMIGEMNDVGMLVDTGHTGGGSIRHAIDVSEKPISCSHAGMEWQAKGQDRIQTDETLKYLANNGGVFGLSAIPGMLTGNMNCTVNDYLNGLDHAIDVMGEDHVGLGTDFIFNVAIEQIATSPDWQGKRVPVGSSVKEVFDGHEGFEDHSKFLNLTRGMIARGWSDEKIEKIMGDNWLRLFAETIG